mgnify:CR=1 FL=1
MDRSRLGISEEALRTFCQNHRIRRLAAFGSVLRMDFSPESDIDLLAEFAPGERVGFIRLGTIEAELSELLGRQVDLNLASSLNADFRDKVLAEAEPLYDAA